MPVGINDDRWVNRRRRRWGPIREIIVDWRRIRQHVVNLKDHELMVGALVIPCEFVQVKQRPFFSRLNCISSISAAVTF